MRKTTTILASAYALSALAACSSGDILIGQKQAGMGYAGAGGATVPGAGGATIPGAVGGGATVPGAGGATVPGAGGGGGAPANNDSCQDRPPLPACGTGDTADKDYDHDGLPNCTDPDIDGDGIPNEQDCAPFFSLASLSHCDDSDLARKDYNGDGIPNCQDPDIDGDGIPNEQDGNPYQKSSAPPTDHTISIADGYYAQGDYHGDLWTAADSGGSGIEPACLTDGDCFLDSACVSGTVARVQNQDWGSTWGVMIGWNLAQSAGSAEASPASLLGKSQIAVNLAGATGLALRAMLAVPNGEGSEIEYCKSLTLGENGARIDLTDMTEACWMTGGLAFDPATMKPTSLRIQIPALSSMAIPFANMCITMLRIE